MLEGLLRIEGKHYLALVHTSEPIEVYASNNERGKKHSRKLFQSCCDLSRCNGV